MSHNPGKLPRGVPRKLAARLKEGTPEVRSGRGVLPNRRVPPSVGAEKAVPALPA